MESGFIRTTDEEVIRSWIEEHGGKPVFTTDQDNEELLYIAFPGDRSEFTELSWEEFFDWFEETNAVFEYAPHVLPGEEAFSYNFASDENVDDTKDDETQLAEDNEMGEENMHDQISEQDM
jgi:hypothetical protein